MLVGLIGAAALKAVIYFKGKNAKKYRQGEEYGSARWGNAKDIEPFIDPVFENNVLLTQTERLMMSGRPKHPKYIIGTNYLTGTLQIAIVTFTVFIRKIFPCAMLGGILVSTTRVNEFMAAMNRIHMDAIEDLRRTLELLKKQGKTILIAEHRIYYLRELVDRIVYMENGAISAVFSPSQFLSIPEEQRHSMGLRALDLSKVQPRAIAENSQKPILEVRNLSLFYKKKSVLDDLNLSAAPGEIIGIIGHNGAGKSTFSRTLCGLHTNYTGQILWDGKELNAKSRLKRSYMVMQDVSYQLFADTLEKECVFGIKHPDLDAAKQAMERLGIYEYRTHHPNTLSGGQKQRAAVAVSMVCRKDVLIFDEPTSGLDYDSMIQVAGLFQTLSKMGKVIFVVTHDYEFLAAACTRVIHLDNGKQQEDYLLSPDNLHRLRDFFLRSERRQNFAENGK